MECLLDDVRFRSFIYDDVNSQEQSINTKILKGIEKDFEKIITDGCEECKKEKGEDFAALVMIALMDHFERDEDNLAPHEYNYIKEQILKCANGKELLGKWEDTSKVFPCPVSELDTPDAHILWNRAINAGYVDSNYQPIDKLNTPVKMAIFARIFAEILGMPVKGQYEPFEKLWGLKIGKLSRAYRSHGSEKSYDDLKEDILSCLKG